MEVTTLVFPPGWHQNIPVAVLIPAQVASSWSPLNNRMALTFAARAARIDPPDVYFTRLLPG